MKITSPFLAVMLLVFIFGGIGLTMAFDLWQTQMTKVPVTFTAGEFAGEYNPADIRGSYTLGDISDLFEIPLVDIETAFGLEQIDNVGNFALKGFESLYTATEDAEIGTDSVRVFVSLYTGLPYTLSSTTFLPQSAVDLLLAHNTDLTAEQIEWLNTHGVTLEDSAVSSDPSAPVTDTESTIDFMIKGKTTFGELRAQGLSDEAIEEIIGAEIPADGTVSVKDFTVAQGLEFEPVKTALQALIDGLSH